MATRGVSTVSGDDGTVAALHDRAINHIFGSGLTLAAILSDPRIDRDVADRLGRAIDDLDRAVGAIRAAALTQAVALLDQAQEGTSSIVSQIDPRPALVSLHYEDLHSGSSIGASSAGEGVA